MHVPWPRPTSVPSGILIHSAVWPQYKLTNVTDRTEQTNMTTVRWHRAPKNLDVQKKRSDHEVRRASPGSGRESMVGKICERGSFQLGVTSETVSELCMVRLPRKCNRSYILCQGVCVPSKNFMKIHNFLLTTNADKNSSGDEIVNVNFYAVCLEATRIRSNNAK